MFGSLLLLKESVNLNLSWNVFTQKGSINDFTNNQLFNHLFLFIRVLRIENIYATALSAESNKSKTFSKAVDDIALKFEARNISANQNLHESVKKTMVEEIRQYFKRGNCRLETGTNAVCVNPTMLNPMSLKWELDPSLCPFDGYLPMSCTELDTSFQERILIRSCQNIFKNLVSSYQRRLKSIQVSFYLQDALEYCYTEKSTKFDVVECSFLADYIGLCNLIPACSGVLADHPEAILCTETQHWTDFDFSMQKYVEESLCCPLSFIPTMYGLQLTLEPTSLYFDQKSRQFFWKKNPSFENMALSSSPVLSQSLNQLAKKCFALYPLETRHGIKHCFPTPWYSPLTFSYIFSSMELRLGGENLFQDVHHLSSLPLAFQVAKRTLDAWRNDQPLLQFYARCSLELKMDVIRNNSRSGTQLLRLILIPEIIYKIRFSQLKEKQGFKDILLLPHVHVIDNFLLEVEKTTDENFATVSFHLLRDHGIEKTHHAILVDIVNDTPISFLNALGSMHVEDNQFRYPFDLEEPKPGLANVEKSLMTLDSCIDHKDECHLQIRLESDSVPGKYFLISIIYVSPNPF